MENLFRGMITDTNFEIFYQQQLTYDQTTF